ncbi:MAG: phospholipid carrier-dependent glycosyltransferase [Steroidobacteraceae bacterium]
MVGQLNLLDAPFSAFCSAAIFAFVQAQRRGDGSRAQRSWMLAAWGAAGLAVLSKGIAIVALSGLTLVLYSALTRDLAPWRRLHLVPGSRCSRRSPCPGSCSWRAASRTSWASSSCTNTSRASSRRCTSVPSRGGSSP